MKLINIIMVLFLMTLSSCTKYIEFYTLKCYDGGKLIINETLVSNIKTYDNAITYEISGDTITTNLKCEYKQDKIVKIN